MKIYFEKYIFQKRYVFLIPPGSNDTLNAECDLLNISFRKIGKNDISDLNSIFPKKEDAEYLKELETRIDDPENWQGYVVREGDLPVGTFWLLIPTLREKLFYSFLTDTDSIHTCSAHVIPSCRGKGIARMILQFSINLSRKEFPERTVCAIVDESNTSSLKTFSRLKINSAGSNYLIKLFGRPVFSIYKPHHGSIKIWLVIRELFH